MLKGWGINNAFERNSFVLFVFLLYRRVNKFNNFYSGDTLSFQHFKTT